LQNKGAFGNMIYCIGDSHSAVFSGEEKMQPIWPELSNNMIPYFCAYRIGPATAYNLHNKKHIIEKIIAAINFKQDDYLMFCFGEVDIRAHLLKQSKLQSKNINAIIEDCVDRYIDSILYYKKYNIKLLIWGVIASWNELKPYMGGPTYGTNSERNLITQKFNNLLQNKCSLIDVKYIDIFQEMLNDDYTTKIEYLDDWDGSHIHLSQSAMPLIIHKFKKEGFIKNEY
jgi:hypothetical protein